MIRDAAGNLYGTTLFGGPANVGVVYKLDPSGVETVLHSFLGGRSGSSPDGRSDRRQHRYVVWNNGNREARITAGVVYKLDAGGETVLYSFTGGADGGCLSLRRDTRFGGESVWDYRIRRRGQRWSGLHGGSEGNETVLYSFLGGSDGAFPSGGVIRDADGNLYGTT